MDRQTLTVICPAYNEETVLGRFYDELKSVLHSESERYEATILFVIDRSFDHTLDVAKQLSAADKRVQVLALSARFGHQMSLLAGLDHAETDAVVMLDTDLQHPPALIPRLLREFEEGYDVVYAIRRDTTDIGLLKRISSRLFYRLMNRLCDVPIREGVADFALVSRRVVEVFRTRIRERNQFLRGLFSWVGFRSTGVPFEVGRRASGSSKYTLGRMVSLAVHGVVSFSKRPLEFAIVVGAGWAVFGLALAVVTVIQYFWLSTLPSGWTTLTVLISMFAGIQLICLGIIGLYIGAIFDEVKARPHYIVEEKVNMDG